MLFKIIAKHFLFQFVIIRCPFKTSAQWVVQKLNVLNTSGLNAQFSSCRMLSIVDVSPQGQYKRHFTSNY